MQTLSIGDKVRIDTPGHAFHEQEGIYLGSDGTEVVPHMVELKGTRFYFDLDDLKLINPEPLFRKQFLETGMVAIIGETKWTVLLDTNQGDLIVCDGSSTRLTNYPDDYFFGRADGKDGIIDRVLRPVALRDYANRVNRQYEVVWEKKKRLTVAEIESKLGYPIEVI